VGPRASLEVEVKKRNPFPASAGDQTPIVQPIAYSLHCLNYPGSLFNNRTLLQLYVYEHKDFRHSNTFQTLSTKYGYLWWWTSMFVIMSWISVPVFHFWKNKLSCNRDTHSSWWRNSPPFTVPTHSLACLQESA
jgi:hypothetical protein